MSKTVLEQDPSFKQFSNFDEIKDNLILNNNQVDSSKVLFRNSDDKMSLIVHKKTK